MVRKLLLILFFTVMATAQTQIGQDIFPESVNGQSGWYVSLSSDGHTVAAGGQPMGENNNTYSSARVYSFEGQSYVQKGQEIIIDNAGLTSNFKRLKVSLSADGSVLAVSTPCFGTSGFNGIARIFQFNGTAWQQLGQDIVGASNDVLGVNLSLSADGTTVAILAEQGFSDQMGYVSVLRYDGISWQEVGNRFQGYLSWDPFEHYSMFQGDISLSDDGNRIAIGTADSSSSAIPYYGQVRVFEYSGANWQQVGQTLHGSVSNTDFGRDVHLTGSGNAIAVGNLGTQATHGFVQVYTLTNGLWAQKGANIVGTDLNDDFGGSVSLSNDATVLAVSASKADNIWSYNQGNVKIFRYSENQWPQVGNTLYGVIDNDFFGYEISLSAAGDRLAVGSPFGNSHYPYYNSGEVKMYDLSNVLTTEHFDSAIFSIYPNPAESSITIQTSEAIEVIYLYNLQGRLLKKENNHTMAISDLASGTYFVQIVTASEKITKKLIKK